MLLYAARTFWTNSSTVWRRQLAGRGALFAPSDYVEWTLAASYAVAGFDLPLAYSNSDVSPSVDGKGEEVPFTLGQSF